MDTADLVVPLDADTVGLTWPLVLGEAGLIGPVLGAADLVVP